MGFQTVTFVTSFGTFCVTSVERDSDDDRLICFCQVKTGSFIKRSRIEHTEKGLFIPSSAVFYMNDEFEMGLGELEAIVETDDKVQALSLDWLRFQATGQA